MTMTLTLSDASNVAGRDAHNRWRFHNNWNNATTLRSVPVSEDEIGAGAVATGTGAGGDAIRAARYHDHWNNSIPDRGADEPNAEMESRASASVTDAAVNRAIQIQDQYEHSARWQYISAF